jgi:hypothetical protein
VIAMAAANLIVERMVIDKLLEMVPAPVISKTRIGHDLAILAALFSIIGVGVLVYAAHLWFQGNYSSDIAAAMTGGLIVVIALILTGVCIGIEKYKQYKIKAFQAEMHDALNSMIDSIDEVLAEPVNLSPQTALIAASFAGFMAGKKFP